MRAVIKKAMLFSALALASFSAAAAEPSAAPAPAKKTGRFEIADTNHDGKLSREEYLAQAQIIADERFKKVDANKDGFITKEEIIAAREARRAKAQSRKQPAQKAQ